MPGLESSEQCLSVRFPVSRPLTLGKRLRLTGCFQYSHNLVTSNSLDLSDTITVSEHDTNLGGCHALSSELIDLVAYFFGSSLDSHSTL